MFPRRLTTRERSVLEGLLAMGVEGVERLRHQAADAQVVGGCDCGCPSIDFFKGPSGGMRPIVNAGVRGSSTFDGLFLYTVDVPGTGPVLGGIEWVGQGQSDPDEFPQPEDLDIALPEA